MSILPSFIEQTGTIQNVDITSTIPVEYGVNFDTGLLTGEKVEGIEAIKVWIWHALHVERFRYAIYSWGYGVELEGYIGQNFSQEYLDDAVKTALEEALAVNPWITGIEDFSASINRDVLSISFKVNTTLGEVTINYDVH